MKKWEYDVTDSDYSVPQLEEVKYRNAEGWEMYAVLKVYDYDDDIYMFYWKRQVTVLTEEEEE